MLKTRLGGTQASTKYIEEQLMKTKGLERMSKLMNIVSRFLQNYTISLFRAVLQLLHSLVAGSEVGWSVLLRGGLVGGGEVGRWWGGWSVVGNLVGGREVGRLASVGMNGSQ